MKDGFYKIKEKGAENWTSVCELRTEFGIQRLYLLGFDEGFDPADKQFIICKYPIPLN